MSTALDKLPQSPARQSSRLSAKTAILQFAHTHRGLLAGAMTGIVLAIGSSGLLLGAVTVAISSFLVNAGMGLLTAMTVGFFVTSFVGLGLGALLVITSLGPLIRHLPEGPEVPAAGRR